MTVKNANQRPRRINTPPNTDGNSAASTISGAPTPSVGITPKQTAACGFALGAELPVAFFSGSSGPYPGGSFSFGGGGSFLPAKPSIKTCRSSSVVPLKVPRRYGSQFKNRQVAGPSSGFLPR